MTRQNLTYYLAERPTGPIVPGKTFRCKGGREALVENLYLALDPALRVQVSDKRTYEPPVEIGETMRGITMSRVLASRTPRVKAGDIISVGGGWTEVAVVPERWLMPLEIPEGRPITEGINGLGGTALTAYFGMTKIGKPKAGETVVVSGAGGSTGTLAGQMAKIMGGAGGGDRGDGGEVKCAWVREALGVRRGGELPVGRPRSSPTWRGGDAGLASTCTNYDNVGGAVLDAVLLARAAPFSRFVMCGMISGYNDRNSDNEADYDGSSSSNKDKQKKMTTAAQRIHMQGIIVADHMDEFPQAHRMLGRWLQEERLQARDHIIKGGLKEFESGIEKLFRGENIGRLLLGIKPVDEN
ncbi:chaperonin 10-like protein [Xylariomycetidae sp. FL2044]|nr:chaperonin 10-like protein [Xylariomycetidae sp. FL2044]